MASTSSVSDPKSLTAELCNWAINLELSQVPQDIQHRAKLLILDGLGCGIVGARLPWSEKAAKAIFELEPRGSCSIFGWEKKLGGPAAALLNSTFIQAFELDDWHPHSPLHSAALLLPALLAALEHTDESHGTSTTGDSFLTAMIVGLEVGPRIGLGLGGGEILSRGWHSGAVFGGPAVAVAVSKLLALSPRRMEWALGHACTQSGGLMSAQFESMAKRMQHGFAARNGLLAAFLARADYKGIECVLERPYGGFFGTFSPGSKASSPINTKSVFASLGKEWEINNILVKPYALMAALHAPVECVRNLQRQHKTMFQKLGNIKSIKIEMGDEAHKHGGWELETTTLEVTGAQMSAAYAVAVQLVDSEVLPTSFAPDKLNREILHELIRKTLCVHQAEYDHSLETRITVQFLDHADVVEVVKMPRGVQPRLNDEEIKEKWKVSMAGLLDEERRQKILNDVMNIEELSSLDHLLRSLGKDVGSILE